MEKMLKAVLILVLAVIVISNLGSMTVSAYSSRQLLSSSPSASLSSGVVGYWEEKLNHVSMPPMLSAMVTPLKPNEAGQARPVVLLGRRSYVVGAPRWSVVPAGQQRLSSIGLSD